LSEDGRNLFLRQTLAQRDDASSVEKISAKEIAWMKENLRNYYNYFREQGFDEVFFSFVPNSASVLEPRHYNGLIPTLQQFAMQQNIPFIDVYDKFSTDPDKHQFFRPGDTHWSNEGYQVWIKDVNEILEKQSRLQVNQ